MAALRRALQGAGDGAGALLGEDTLFELERMAFAGHRGRPFPAAAAVRCPLGGLGGGLFAGCLGHAPIMTGGGRWLRWHLWRQHPHLQEPSASTRRGTCPSKPTRPSKTRSTTSSTRPSRRVSRRAIRFPSSSPVAYT